MMTEETTQLNNWEADLAKFAQESLETEQNAGGGLPWIGTAAGQLSYQGNNIVDNKLVVVVLAAAFENHLYTERFMPGKAATPTCFALSMTDELLPHSIVPSPICGNCAECPQNQWESAENGKGKACKNVRRLGLVAATDLDRLTEASIAYLKVPVTSAKAFSSYVKTVAAVAKRPEWAVLTEISLLRDPKTQFKLTFKCLGNVPTEHLSAIKDKREACLAEILTPYSAPKPVDPEVAAAEAKKKKY
jgi:hypothetical protein